MKMVKVRVLLGLGPVLTKCQPKAIFMTEVRMTPRNQIILNCNAVEHVLVWKG